MSSRRLFGFALAILLATTPVFAGKPSGGGRDKDSKPPVTIVPDASAFEVRPEGILDKATGVVWGYSNGDISGVFNHTHWSAENVNAWYSPLLIQAALDSQSRGEEYLELAEFYRDSDPVRSAYYQQAATEQFNAVPVFENAATLAAQYSDWRAPTIEEARAAVAKGLFTYGEQGLNLWTPSPVAVPGPPGSSGLTWSSTYGGKKNGSDTWWAYSAYDGGAVRIRAYANVIGVRTYSP